MRHFGPEVGFEDQDARLTFNALADAKRDEGVLTGRVGALITAHA